MLSLPLNNFIINCMDKRFPFKQEVHRLQFTMPEETADTNLSLYYWIPERNWGEHYSWCTSKSFTSASALKWGTHGGVSPAHMLTQEIPADTASIADFWYATADNTTSGLLMLAVTNGWPDTRKDCQPLLMDYWTYREEISAENGLLFKGHRLIIPAKLPNRTV